MNRLPLTIVALALICVSAYAQSPGDKLWEKMHAYVTQLPDCEYRYTYTTEDRPEREPMVHNMHFSHYKGKFFFMDFKKEGDKEPYEWLAYDGTTFFHFISGTLAFGKNFEPKQIKKFFVGAFGHNPPFVPFYYCIFSGKQVNGSLPFLNESKLWKDALSDLKQVPREANSVNDGYQITWLNRSRIFYLTAQYPYPVECVTIPTPDTGRRIRTKVTGVGVYPVGPILPFLIPEKMVQTVEEKDQPVRNVVEVQMNQASFKLITNPPPPWQYRIPQGIARRLYDSDQHATLVK